MPAPLAPSMTALAIPAYGMPLGPEALEYLDSLFSAVTTAWDNWQKSIQFGMVLVDGAGIGAFSGIGKGGVMTGAPFVMALPSFKANSPQQIEFTQGLITALNQVFTPWPATFKFNALNYVGTSGASPVSPGPVAADNVPTPLGTAGKGGPLKGIADAWIPLLKPPAFDLDNPQAKSKPLIKAIGTAIETAFETDWLLKTNATANKLTAVGAPGAGTVSGTPSQPGGKLV